MLGMFRWVSRSIPLRDTQSVNNQDKLPIGATQMGVIFGSDKTPVSLGTGGLEMHPLFITLANIASDVRMKATSHAWACVAFLPVVSFQVHDDYQGILKARLWHQCVEIITESLRDVAARGAYVSDPLGKRRRVFTPLVAWTADLPEQQLIAGVAKNASPVSTAITKEFSDPFPHPPRSADDGSRASRNTAIHCRGYYWYRSSWLCSHCPCHGGLHLSGTIPLLDDCVDQRDG